MSEEITICPYCNSILEEAKLDFIRNISSKLSTKAGSNLSLAVRIFSFLNGGLSINSNEENSNVENYNLRINSRILVCENCNKLYKFKNVGNKKFIKTKAFIFDNRDFYNYFKKLLKLLSLDKSPVEKFNKLIKKRKLFKEEIINDYSILEEFITSFYVAEVKELDLNSEELSSRSFLLLFISEDFPFIMIEYYSDQENPNIFILKRIMTVFPKGFTLEKLLKLKKKIGSEKIFEKMNIHYLTMKEVLILTLYFIKNNIIKGKTTRQKILFRLYFKFLRKEGLITKEYQIIFKPHHFGPYSELLEEIVKDLKAERKIEVTNRNTVIKITEDGKKFAKSLIEQLNKTNPGFIGRFKKEIEKISGLDSKHLLEEIYYELFFGDKKDRDLLKNSKLKSKFFKEFENLEKQLIKEL